LRDEALPPDLKRVAGARISKAA